MSATVIGIFLLGVAAGLGFGPPKPHPLTLLVWAGSMACCAWVGCQG